MKRQIIHGWFDEVFDFPSISFFFWSFDCRPRNSNRWPSSCSESVLSRRHFPKTYLFKTQTPGSKRKFVLTTELLIYLMTMTTDNLIYWFSQFCGPIVANNGGRRGGGRVWSGRIWRFAFFFFFWFFFVCFFALSALNLLKNLKTKSDPALRIYLFIFIKQCEPSIYLIKSK